MGGRGGGGGGSICAHVKTPKHWHPYGYHRFDTRNQVGMGTATTAGGGGRQDLVRQFAVVLRYLSGLTHRLQGDGET